MADARGGTGQIAEGCVQFVDKQNGGDDGMGSIAQVLGQSASSFKTVHNTYQAVVRIHVAYK